MLIPYTTLTLFSQKTLRIMNINKWKHMHCHVKAEHVATEEAQSHWKTQGSFHLYKLVEADLHNCS